MTNVKIFPVLMLMIVSGGAAHGQEFTGKTLRAAEQYCDRYPDARESGDADEHLLTIRECAKRVMASAADPAPKPGAEDCRFEPHQVTVQGTVVQSAFGRTKYMALVSPSPICGNETMVEVDAPKKWLGHRVIVTGDLGGMADREWQLLTVKSIKDVQKFALSMNAEPATKATPAAGTRASKLAALSCREWTAETGSYSTAAGVFVDYISSLPNADKLGFGSPCHLGNLVDAECKLHPTVSVLDAINELMVKAQTGNLPHTPRCGA